MKKLLLIFINSKIEMEQQYDFTIYLSGSQAIEQDGTMQPAYLRWQP